MKFDISLKGIKNLAAKISREYARIVDDGASEKKQELLNDLIRYTPIDTGYARSRWMVSYNKEAQANFTVTGSFLLKNYSFTVSNDAPYIKYLNMGSSKQAPPFFIEKTILTNGYKINSVVIK